MRTQLHSPRMALRRRQIALCLSFLAVAIPVAGCGSSNGSEDLTGEPFTAQDGEAFTGALNELKGRIGDGDCDGAQDKLDALVVAVNAVPADTDEGLKNDLLDLLDQLRGQVSDQCMPGDDTTSSTDTDETTTSSDETTTSTTTSTTDETQTDTDTTKTDSTETEPNIPSPPENSLPGQGGTPPGQGGTPPGQGGGNGGSDSGGISPRSGP